jgi:6,7-dimethyl-8-ribityllumazine synthase
MVRAAEKGADAARVAIEMANLVASIATLGGGADPDEDD